MLVMLAMFPKLECWNGRATVREEGRSGGRAEALAGVGSLVRRRAGWDGGGAGDFWRGTDDESCGATTDGVTASDCRICR